MNYLILVALLRHYRFHPWQLVFNLTGIAAAVCLMTAIDLLIHSSRENFSIAAQQLSGQATHHITSSSGWLPETLYSQLVRRFSVTAHPIIQHAVKLSNDGELYTLLGVDLFKNKRFQPFITKNAIPQNPQNVVTNQSQQSTQKAAIDANEFNSLLSFMSVSSPTIIMNQYHVKQPWQPGDQITLYTADKTITVTLLATFSTEASELFDHMIVMDIGQAQQWLNFTKKISRIDLTLPTPEQLTALRQWLPAPYQITPRAEMARQLGQMSDALSISLSALALLVVATGFFIVFNTVHFSLLQRHPLFIQLSQLGITTQQKAQLLCVEMVLIATIATGLGLGLGILVSAEIQQLAQQTTENLYGMMPVKRFHLSPVTLIKTALVGIVGPLLITSYDIWQASRLTTLGQQQLSLSWQPRQLLGLGVIGGFMVSISVLLFYQSTGLISCFIAIGALLIGYAAWIPVINWLTALFAHQCQLWSNQLKGILWLYFWQDNQRHGITTSIAMMALVIALATAIGIGIMVDSFRITVTNWLEHRLSADIYIQRQHWGSNHVTELPIEFRQQLSQHPAVAHIGYSQSINVSSQDHSFRLSSSNAPKPMQQGYLFTSGQSDTIWQQWLQPNQLIISEPLARRLQLKQNSSVEINTPRGKQLFTVAGIYYDYTSEYGRALISNTNYQRFWPAPIITTMAIYLTDKNQQANLIRFIYAQWGNQLNLKLSTPKSIKQRSLAIFDQTFLVTNGLRTIAIIIAVIGMASTLMALQLCRTSEFIQLQQLGFTRRHINLFQITQMVWFGCLCCLLSLPIGYSLSYWLVTGVNVRAFGWSMPLLFNWLTILPTLGFTLIAVFIACCYPIFRPPQPLLNHEIR